MLLFTPTKIEFRSFLLNTLLPVTQIITESQALHGDHVRHETLKDAGEDGFLVDDVGFGASFEFIISVLVRMFVIKCFSIDFLFFGFKIGAMLQVWKL